MIALHGLGNAQAVGSFFGELWLCVNGICPRTAVDTPNGEIKATCRQHRAGFMINEIDDKDEFYDASSAYRERAMAGVLYSE